MPRLLHFLEEKKKKNDSNMRISEKKNAGGCPGGKKGKEIPFRPLGWGGHKKRRRGVNAPMSNEWGGGRGKEEGEKKEKKRDVSSFPPPAWHL